MEQKFFFLASYPRSGNTLCRLLLDHHFDVNARSIYGPPPPERRTHLTRRIHEVRLDAPIVALKTHQSTANKPQADAIVIVRDGRDAAVSFAHYLQDFHANPLEYSHLLYRIVRGAVPDPYFDSNWTSFYQYWLNRHEGRIVLIRFEELLQNPFNVIAEALHKLHPGTKVVREGPISTFEDLHKAKPAFFRKGATGTWREEMSPEVEKVFWQHNGTLMEALNYPR